MRVKSIVLDGFKSYAHRKELADLSPHFNAITGLNGSGKSNIFDAICFVMGITNLKRVRADDPRELIFRAGTTGVHAARVTIEFTNDDRATAPPGYSCDDYPVITVGRQIKLGGKQQFFFNNTVSMQSKVKRFFESISLNVDNPHFMVLQGTVHKLIGMRAQDILALVEEAVGTRTFDHRRRTAEALIRGKERKMKEIDDNMETHIGPMLAAMRADQEAYQRFLHLSDDLDTRRRFRAAYDYHTRVRELDAKTQAIEQLQRNAAEARDRLQTLPDRERELTRQLMLAQEKLAQPCEAAVALRGEEVDVRRRESRVQAQLDSVATTRRRVEQQLSALRTEQARVAAAQAAFQSQRAQHEQLLRDVHAARARVTQLQQALQLAHVGVRAAASGRSLEEERRDVEVQTVQHTAALRRAQDAVAALLTQLQHAQAARAKQASALSRLRGDVARAEREFTAAAERGAAVVQLLQRADALAERLTHNRQAYHAAYEQLQREATTTGGAAAAAGSGGGGGRGVAAGNFDLDFGPPSTRRNGSTTVARRSGVKREHNNDNNDDDDDDDDVARLERCVLGRVGELVYPAEARYAMALQVGAQHLLLRVVVTTDTVAQQIIERGLRQRTAFLALNQLQQQQQQQQQQRDGSSGQRRGGGGVSAAQLAAAQRIAQQHAAATGDDGFVCLASTLVACSDDVADNDNNNNNNNNNEDNTESRSSCSKTRLAPLVEYVYGNFLVCSSLALAQELAYAADVRVKAVTLDGEVAEPHGLLTGGATTQLRDVFAELRQYRARKSTLRQLQQCIARDERELARTHAALQQRRDEVAQYRAAEEALELARQRLRVAHGLHDDNDSNDSNSKDSNNNDNKENRDSDPSSKRVLSDVDAKLARERAAVAAHEAALQQLRERRAAAEAAAAVTDDDVAQRQLREQLADAEARVATLTAAEARDAAAYERAEADLEQRADDVASKLRDADAECAALQREHAELQEQLAQLRHMLDDVRARSAATEAQRQALERDVDGAQDGLARLAQLRASLENVCKNADVDVRELQKAADELRRAVHEDERRHASWLREAAAQFGDVAGPYYFDDVARTQATLAALREAEAQLAVMSRRMNRKATVLYDERKREYDELVKQRVALSEDKAAIQACILGIEQRKWQALDRMVGVVSSIFGKLFTACLPGASAQLTEERDEHGHLVGLGVRVLMNGQAKESLSELSGGQRSLLALCLILALLRVRPAPIYILDEIDAALDPSHTQGIGRMLQLYFPRSQFLLVSLKDGMFNNANVLYHVRNTQGYSEVTRIERRDSNNNNSNNNDNNNNNNDNDREAVAAADAVAA